MKETHERVADVLDVHLRALEKGSAPSRAALLAEHADIARELAAALDSLDFIRRAATSLACADDPLEGRALGDYKLLREVGRGGMAVVYEAEQVSLGRRVALKVLPFAAVLDPKQLQRFKNEALAAAHLRHPNIVPVYGVGSERGVHYYAMQYVEGQSLAAAVRTMKGGGTGEGPRTPISSHGSNREPGYIRMAAALGMQAAEALDHAHQLGIVHRDVKPANLLVDHAGTLWITDFGLARSLNDAGLTMTGEILGTIRYMSPEQALAKRVPIDHRTDVYSLGATLYELFTLEPAFPGEDPHIVIQDIATKEPAPPRRLNPALPRDLETVLLKAMSKEPAGRYATAQEMADDLKRFLEDKPVLARRPSVAARTRRWARRNGALVSAALVVLFVGLAALALGAKREESNTRAALQRAEANLELARDAVDKFLVEAGVAEELPDAPLPPPRRRELLQAALAFYERHADGIQDRAAVENRLQVLGALHRYEEALALTDRVLAVRPDSSVALMWRGKMLFHTRRFDRAVVALDHAIEINPRLEFAHNYRGLALNALGRFDEALAAHDRAVGISPDSSLAHSFRGIALQSLRRFEDALADHDRAAALAPDSATVHGNRAVALQLLCRYDEALKACDRCIASAPYWPQGYVNRAAALRALGRFDEALKACDRAIEIDPTYAKAHHNRGLALDELGRFDEALAAYDRAIEIDPLWAPSHNNRSNTLLNLERSGEALDAADRAIEIDPDLLEAHCSRGNALWKLGRLDQAVAAFDRAIEIDPRCASAHSNRGAVLADLGRHDEALAAFERAIEIDPNEASAYSNRGRVFRDLGRTEEAQTACERAVALDPDNAALRFHLGIVLAERGDPEGAVRQYRETVRLDPRHADAYYNLGVLLSRAGDPEGAVREYREAIRLRPNDAAKHYGLGCALAKMRDYDGAILAFDHAIRLNPDFAEAHCNRGRCLFEKGRFEDALRSFRTGHDLGSRRATWPYSSGEWIEKAERMVQLDGRLGKVLAGEGRPQDANECVTFASLLFRRGLHAEAARMWAEAFGEDATLAEDLRRSHRYNAARCAALAAAVGGSDAAEWRGRTLAWLRADLAAREKAATDLAPVLEHWKRDPDLAAVRDRLDDLPAEERGAWTRLWVDVDAILSGTGDHQ